MGRLLWPHAPGLHAPAADRSRSTGAYKPNDCLPSPFPKKIMSSPILRAATSVSLRLDSAFGPAGFKRRATTEAAGARSCSSPRRLPANSSKNWFTPVALPPGHLVGEREKLVWNLEAKRLGGLEVDHRLVLGWRLYWNLGWFLALENTIDIGRGAPKIIGPVHAVGQQTASFSEETEWIDSRETIARRKRCDFYAMGIREAIRHHDKAAIRLAGLSGNDGFKLISIANRCGNRFHCKEGAGCFEGVQPIIGICRRYRVEQHRDPGDAWCNLLEQFQPLAGHRRLRKDETGDVAPRPGEARDEAAADRVRN